MIVDNVVLGAILGIVVGFFIGLAVVYIYLEKRGGEND